MAKDLTKSLLDTESSNSLDVSNQIIRMPYIRQLLAHDWVWSIALWTAILAIGLTVGMNIYTKTNNLVIAALCAATGGFVYSYIPLFILMRFIMKLNGAPFHIGDRVQILTGSHRGKIESVYEIWKDHKEVRLDLGQQAKNEVKDVFSFLQIRRIMSDSKETDLVSTST